MNQDGSVVGGVGVGVGGGAVFPPVISRERPDFLDAADDDRHRKESQRCSSAIGIGTPSSMP
jgi:hypothetical protein